MTEQGRPAPTCPLSKLDVCKAARGQRGGWAAVPQVNGDFGERGERGWGPTAQRGGERPLGTPRPGPGWVGGEVADQCAVGVSWQVGERHRRLPVDHAPVLRVRFEVGSRVKSEGREAPLTRPRAVPWAVCWSTWRWDLDTTGTQRLVFALGLCDIEPAVS